MTPEEQVTTLPEAQAELTTLSHVVRGLLHDLANLVTALEGATTALEHEGAVAVPRAKQDLRLTTDRLFALHTQCRSLLPDRGGAEALDPRAIAAEVAALLALHAVRPCAVHVGSGNAAPILGEPALVRRQLLAACDLAAGKTGDLAFSFRVDGDTVSAVRDDGVVFWTWPTLAAARGHK